jgi:hypothetical protein
VVGVIEALSNPSRSARHLLELAQTWPDSLPNWVPDDVPAAADLYRAGWSLARIAEKFRTAGNTVRARLLEVGVIMRDTHGRVQ